MAGCDIKEHKGTVKGIITSVRDWLQSEMDEETCLPDLNYLEKCFEKFSADLPSLCNGFKIIKEELHYKEFKILVEDWLKKTK